MKSVLINLLKGIKSPKKALLILKKRYFTLPIQPVLKELEEKKIIKAGNDKDPKVSVIILTYNNLAYSKACIRSVLLFSNYKNLEIIIVDNASKDKTQEFLKELKTEFPEIKLVLNKTNTGFAAGCNTGLKKATGEYVILLNNDTIVTPGWVRGLIKPLENKKIGLVGPITNFMWNHQEVNVFYRSLNGLLEKSKTLKKDKKGKIKEYNDIAFFCVALRKEVIEKIGTLDERFGLGMFEDDDYCLRIKKAGYKIVVTDEVFIHHFGQISLFSLGKEKYSDIFLENKSKFEEKWGVVWEAKK